MKLKIIIMLLILLITKALYAEALYPFTAKDDSVRFSALTQQIRCVVCQNQNIADSNAPLANDLRKKVYEMVLAKKTDEEIKGYLSNRYGDFILLQPRFNLLTSLLWLFPVLGLLTISLMLKRYLFK